MVPRELLLVTRARDLFEYGRKYFMLKCSAAHSLGRPIDATTPGLSAVIISRTLNHPQANFTRSISCTPALQTLHRIPGSRSSSVATHA